MVFKMSKKQMGSSFIEDNYIEEGPSQPTQLYQAPKRQSKYLNQTMSTQSTPTEKREKKLSKKSSPPKCQGMRPGFRMPCTAPWAESWGGRRDPPGHCLQWSRSPVRRGWWPLMECRWLLKWQKRPWLVICVEILVTIKKKMVTQLGMTQARPSNGKKNGYPLVI